MQLSFKAIWHDPVWSKVIAGLILSGGLWAAVRLELANPIAQAIATLVAAIVLIRVGVKVGERFADKSLAPIIAIQEPGAGKVPTWKTVRGFAYPSPSLVQVFVEAGGKHNMRWFLQGDVYIDRYEWTARCRF